MQNAVENCKIGWSTYKSKYDKTKLPLAGLAIHCKQTSARTPILSHRASASSIECAENFWATKSHVKSSSKWFSYMIMTEYCMDETIYD